MAVLPEYDADGNIEGYLHPYETELNRFEVPATQLTETVPIEPTEIVEEWVVVDNVKQLVKDETLVYVDNVKQLKELVETELAGVTEIAVDVEHHSYRTFQVRNLT